MYTAKKSEFHVTLMVRGAVAALRSRGREGHYGCNPCNSPLRDMSLQNDTCPKTRAVCHHHKAQPTITVAHKVSSRAPATLECSG